MQPIINLKSFVAVLILLVVPAALLVAYFRNYSAEEGGHEHGGAPVSVQGSDNTAMKPSGHSHSAREHGNMKMPPSGNLQSGPEAESASAPKLGGRKTMEHDTMQQPSFGQPSSPGQGSEPTHATSTREPLDLASSSVLPGIPGVSRLYHIGATGFFLNMPPQVTLTIKQKEALNRMKRSALLGKSTAQRQIGEAEQELWELTGVDEPDFDQIQAKVHAIEKLRSAQRMAFIVSVGKAAEILTNEQRQALIGAGEPAGPVGK